MDEIFKRLLEILKDRMGWRHFLELLVFLLGVAVSLNLASRDVTTAQVLIVAGWIVGALAYLWFAYHGRLARRHSQVMLALMIVGIAIWGSGLWVFATSTDRRISRLIGSGENF